MVEKQIIIIIIIIIITVIDLNSGIDKYQTCSDTFEVWWNL